MPDKPLSWLPIAGPVSGAGPAVTYHRQEGEERGVWPSSPTGYIRCNKKFDSGAIRFDVKVNQDFLRCHLVLNDGRDRPLFIGINYGLTPFGAAVHVQNKWETLAAVGSGPAERDKWISVEVRVVGSEVTCLLNGVFAFRLAEVIYPSPVCFWFEGFGQCSVRNIAIDDASAKAFVVMQFGDVYDSIYKDVICPLLDEYGYRAFRADEIYESGLIIEDINSSLRQSSLVIADITPDNPNVYYEVGFAHALGKETILLCDKERDRLPFDLSGFRTIFYENSIRGKPLVEEKLRRHLEKIVRL